MKGITVNPGMAFGKPCVAGARIPVYLTLKLLRDHGHDLVTAKDLGLQRADNSVLLARAVELGRVFLTRDLDLADLRHYPPNLTAGIVVLRIQARYRWTRPHCLVRAFGVRDRAGPYACHC